AHGRRPRGAGARSGRPRRSRRAAAGRRGLPDNRPETMKRTALRRALAAAVMLAACARPEPPLPAATRDLAALLPLADRIEDEGSIDFGIVAARRHLGTGWGPDEASGEV